MCLFQVPLSIDESNPLQIQDLTMDTRIRFGAVSMVRGPCSDPPY